MSDASSSASTSQPAKSTGPLVEPATASLASVSEAPLEAIPANLPDRNFFLRLGELMIFLVAVVGAVALGLAIASYFTAHTYIAAYLLAYAGFRCADLLVREEYGPDPARDAVVRRVADQGPLLLLFFAAPAERTYFLGGEAPRWLSGLALALELGGLWLAPLLVRRGFYRFIRHPVYVGIYVALIAWPIAYGAPVSAILTVVIVGMVMNRLIQREEKTLVERYGDDYRNYQEESDKMIPNIW